MEIGIMTLEQFCKGNKIYDILWLYNELKVLIKTLALLE